VVPKEALFKEYIYYSSMSKTIPLHFVELARDIEVQLKSQKRPLVVEIGSNDGVLLKNIDQSRIRVLGVEPAENIASLALATGIDTINNFFSKEVAVEIVQSRGQANVIVGCNVVGHIDDLRGLLEATDILLTDDGVFICEFPYLVDLLRNVEYDTIYHEHLSYFSVRPLVHLFGQFGMEIHDVKRFGVHGGSIRVFASRKRTTEIPVSVSQLIKLELEMKLDQFETYSGFSAKVESSKGQLVSLVRRLKDEGNSLAGYGAPAKGNILLNYCGIGPETLDYIVDATPSKQGLYSPGVRIPVVSPKRFVSDPPNYALMLAWNYKNEILEKEINYQMKGGRFIIPVPIPVINDTSKP
tara:strand:+ start:2068 stop:3132 length:1065 start_codon:yes stop_codon:yes gene_type:complete